MKFTFEESELLNGLFGENARVTEKSTVLNRLHSLTVEDEQPELTEILDNLIAKVQDLDEVTFSKVFDDLPVSSIMPY